MEILYTPPPAAASAFQGTVTAYANLPVDGSAAIGDIWLVRTSTGVWFVNRKQAGLYQRIATTGVLDADWHYLGEWLEEFSDANFTVYNGTDNTKGVKFDVSGISSGATRTLTPPNFSGTIATLAGVETLTNKTLTGAALNGTLGATTPSTVAATTITASSTVTTAGRIQANYADPLIQWFNTGGGADQKRYDFQATGAVFVGRLINDADTSANNWLVVNRSGITVGTISLNNLNNTPIGVTTPNTGAFTALTATGSITTGAPSGGTAQPWKLGAVASVSPTAQNRTIQLEVNGTTYFVTAKTSND